MSPSRSRLILAAAGFVALFLCLVTFGAIAEDVHAQEAIVLDDVATPFLHALASPALDTLMWTLTTIGSTAVVGPLFVLALVALFVARRRREAGFLAVAVGGSVLLNEGLKLIFQRARPQLAWADVIPEYSFPSGHTMNSLSFYVALGLIAWTIWGRRVGIVAVAFGIALTVLIGMSRIYLGYHYFSDVVGGFLAGLAWLIVLAAAFDLGPALLRRVGRQAKAKADAAIDASTEAVR